MQSPAVAGAEQGLFQQCSTRFDEAERFLMATPFPDPPRSAVERFAEGVDPDAVQVAIDKEKRSYDFYEHQAGNAAYNTEKEFYTTLAIEEREHELALLDYYEYLADPAGWFVKSEHSSLDGG